MKKLKPREWILIIVPLLLLAIAATLQFRPQWNNVFKPRFYIESAQPVELTPFEVAQGFDTKWEVVLNHSWPRPKWWNGQGGGSGRSDKIRLYQKVSTQPLKRTPHNILWSAMFDRDKNRYVARCLIKLSSVPNREELILRAPIEVFNYTSGKKVLVGKLPFEYSIRSAYQKTVTPVVSRESGLSVHRVFVSPATLSYQGGGYTLWVRMFYKRRTNLTHSSSKIDFSHDIIDEQGRDVSDFMPFIGTTYSAELSDLHNASNRDKALHNKIQTTRSDEWYFEDFWINLPLTTKRRLFLNRAFSFRGNWPLQFKTEIWNENIRQKIRAGQSHNAAFQTTPFAAEQS